MINTIEVESVSEWLPKEKQQSIDLQHIAADSRAILRAPHAEPKLFKQSEKLVGEWDDNKSEQRKHECRQLGLDEPRVNRKENDDAKKWRTIS